MAKIMFPSSFECFVDMHQQVGATHYDLLKTTE